MQTQFMSSSAAADTSASSDMPSDVASSSSSSPGYSEVWNYLWFPLLVSFSKEASLAKAQSSILLPGQVGPDSESLSMPRNPAPDPKLNYRPVIGILSHPGDGASGRLNNGSDTSYIAASYVKFVESAGARVIPLIYNEPREILFEKLNLVNGVLFTGGWAKAGLYYETVKAILKKVLEKNDAGDHFPLYGICLGFELITMIISEDRNILESFSAADMASTIKFIENTQVEGTVFQRFPPDLLRKLSTDYLVMQNHHYGISPGRFSKNPKLSNFFKILTTSLDEDNKFLTNLRKVQQRDKFGDLFYRCQRRGLQLAKSEYLEDYVSTVQAYDYPVTGFQWHPEKNAFEWGSSRIPHSDDAIQVTQHVANFFVSEARKSANRPPARKVLDNLIYNYSPTYCGKAGKGYDEVYIFASSSPKM